VTSRYSQCQRYMVSYLTYYFTAPLSKGIVQSESSSMVSLGTKFWNGSCQLDVTRSDLGMLMNAIVNLGECRAVTLSCALLRYFPIVNRKQAIIVVETSSVALNSPRGPKFHRYERDSLVSKIEIWLKPTRTS
jgi:hypothetical protein